MRYEARRHGTQLSVARIADKNCLRNEACSSFDSPSSSACLWTSASPTQPWCTGRASQFKERALKEGETGENGRQNVDGRLRNALSSGEQSLYRVLSSDCVASSYALVLPGCCRSWHSAARSSEKTSTEQRRGTQNKRDASEPNAMTQVASPPQNALSASAPSSLSLPCTTRRHDVENTL